MNSTLRAPIAALLLCLLVACGGAPGLPPAAPESTYITRQPVLDADALGQLGRDSNSWLVIDDVRPYAEAAWQSGFFDPFAPDAGSTDGAAWDWLPSAVTMGVGDRGVRSVDALVRLYITASLAIAASAETSSADDAERARALKAALDAARGFEFAGMTLAVRFRGEAQAGQAYFGLMGALAAMAPDLMGALTLAPGPDALDLTLAAPEAWPIEVMSGALNGLGIGRLGDDVTPLAQALRAAQITARLERDGLWLRLRFGPASTAPPLTPGDVELPLAALPGDALPGASQPGERPPLVAGGVEMAPWKQVVAGWGALWQQWAPTPTGRQLLLMDTGEAGQLIDLETIVRRAAEQGQASSFRFDLRDGDLRLRLVERAVPGPPAWPLTDDGLLRWLPADAPAMGLNNQQDLGRWMADILWSIEDRLARRALREDWSDEGAGVYSALSDSYYRNYAALRRLVLEEREHPFAAPYGWAMLTPEGAAPQLLMVAAVDPPGGAVAYFERLSTLALAPLARALPPAERPQLVEADLGLGVKTWAFRLDAGPNAEVLRAVGFEPHIFEQDGVFVLSTDAGLSRRALARAEAAASLVDGRASSAWRFEPAALRVPAAVLADATGLDPEARERLSGALRWFAGMRWRSRYEGHDRVSEGAVRFADPNPSATRAALD